MSNDNEFGLLALYQRGNMVEAILDKVGGWHGRWLLAFFQSSDLCSPLLQTLRLFSLGFGSVLVEESEKSLGYRGGKD